MITRAIPSTGLPDAATRERMVAFMASVGS